MTPIHHNKPPVITKDMGAPDPIPQKGMDQAMSLLQHGRLTRYGEASHGESDVSLLEAEFARYVNTRYVVAINSCGCSLFIALKCAGVKQRDHVLTNAFTLAPVPGAIAHAGANAILLECTRNYTLDLDDLDKKASQSNAKTLLLSHMRGHIVDMDEVTRLCRKHHLFLIEDCAHTMGASWAGQPTGTFGRIGCFSTQTYKHINSGEGGLLVTHEDELAAKAILYSGSYMMYGHHLASPPPKIFESIRYKIPNFSMRMSNLAASILRPQIADMPSRIDRWNKRYSHLVEKLSGLDQLVIPSRDAREGFVGSSIQFSLVGLSHNQIESFLTKCQINGVHIKWFGQTDPIGFTSCFEHWHYLETTSDLKLTRSVLEGLCDMRISLQLTLNDYNHIAIIIRDALEV